MSEVVGREEVSGEKEVERGWVKEQRKNERKKRRGWDSGRGNVKGEGDGEKGVKDEVATVAKGP